MPVIGSLNGVRAGQRSVRPVVLLHSAGLDLTYWGAQIDYLVSHGRDVIAVDLPGHGRSPGGPADVRIDAMATAVADAIRSAGVHRVDLVGLSVGGAVAQRIAVDEPQLVSSLALLDTGSYFSDAARQAMRARAATVRQEGMLAILDGLFGHWLLPATLDQRPHLRDRGVKTLLTQDNEVHAALWEAIADFDLRDRVSEIAVPTLVLVGEHDSSSPLASSQALVDAIRGARLHVISDAAHLSPIERPEAINEHLGAFLNRVSALDEAA